MLTLWWTSTALQLPWNCVLKAVFPCPLSRADSTKRFMGYISLGRYGERVFNSVSCGAAHALRLCLWRGSYVRRVDFRNELIDEYSAVGVSFTDLGGSCRGWKWQKPAKAFHSSQTHGGKRCPVAGENPTIARRDAAEVF